MDQQEIQFFENSCEIPAAELLHTFEAHVERFIKLLRPQQLAYIVKDHAEAPASLAGQKLFLRHNYQKFATEYLIHYFSRGKSERLIQRVFRAAFAGAERMHTSDRLIQLIALYRKRKEHLRTIYAFQKLQRRGYKVHELLYPPNVSLEAFADFATCENIQQLLQAVPTPQATLFGEEKQAPHYDPLYCYHVAQTENSVVLFLKSPQERVFVMPYLSTVGDHRYKSADIILKFSRTRPQVSVYASSKLGIAAAEHLASSFAKAPVQSRPLQESVDKQTAQALVAGLLSTSLHEDRPYASEIGFMDPAGGCRLCVSLLEGAPASLRLLAERHHFSLENLEDVTHLEVLFRKHMVHLSVQHVQGLFFLRFTSRSFSAEDRTLFQEWGEENYGVRLISQ